MPTSLVLPTSPQVRGQHGLLGCMERYVDSDCRPGATLVVMGSVQITSNVFDSVVVRASLGVGMGMGVGVDATMGVGKGTEIRTLPTTLLSCMGAKPHAPARRVTFFSSLQYISFFHIRIHNLVGSAVHSWYT